MFLKSNPFQVIRREPVRRVQILDLDIVTLIVLLLQYKGGFRNLLHFFLFTHIEFHLPTTNITLVTQIFDRTRMNYNTF